MLTTTEAAAVLGVKADTIKHWCKQGKFPGAYCIANRLWQIPREDVDALIKNPPRGRGRPRHAAESGGEG